MHGARGSLLRIYNIVLTCAIAMFASVEGYSTYAQVVLEERRNRIEDIRNELEKAYDPLYSILSRADTLLPIDDRSKQIMVPVKREEKTRLDNIMVTYPFMFPYEIVTLWQAKIRDIKPLTAYPGNHTFDFAIPLEFRDKIEEEYNRRVEEYYVATGRKKELSR